MAHSASGSKEIQNYTLQTLSESQCSTVNKTCISYLSKPSLPASDASLTVTEKIESVIINILRSLANEAMVELKLPNRRHEQNVKFDGVKMKMPRSSAICSNLNLKRNAVRMWQMLTLLENIYELMQLDTFATKRDLFYKNVSLFKKQVQVDGLIDDIACMLRISRFQMHVLSTSKGLIYGNLIYRDSAGSEIDCSAGCTMLPMDPEMIQFISSDAIMIIVVEKDASFQALVRERKFYQQLLPKTIVITGKGMPDLSTRILVKKLHRHFGIPVFCLCDGDPHGIEILCVYKYGSMSMAYDSHRLALPQIKWLGILPTDVVKLKIPKRDLLPFSVADVSKCKSLLERQYIKQHEVLRLQIEFLQEFQCKVEIQAVANLGINYLASTYIPMKLQNRAWID